MQTTTERYLDEFARELETAPLSRKQRATFVEDVAGLLAEGATPRDLGPAAELAANVAASVRDESESGGIWDPSDERRLVPKRYGIGKDVGWGAVAVELGLVRPDDLDQEVLDAIPHGVVTAVRWLPAALAAATTAASLLGWRRGVTLPIRTSLSGRVKRSLSPRLGALVTSTCAAAVGVFGAMPSKSRSELLARNARATSLNASLLASLATGFAQRNGRIHPALQYSLIALSFAAEGAVLVIATRAGLAKVGGPAAARSGCVESEAGGARTAPPREAEGDGDHA